MIRHIGNRPCTRTFGDPGMRLKAHTELWIFADRGLQRCAGQLGNHDERDRELRRVRPHAIEPRVPGVDIARVDDDGRSSTGQLCN